MKQKIEFNAIIKQNNNINAGYVEFPFDTDEIFGKKRRIPVKAIFDNKIEYRGSLIKMKTPCHILGLSQTIRKELKKSFGDVVNVCLWEDAEERIVEIPDEMLELLTSNPIAHKVFQTLSFTKRKEYVQFIVEAKKPETKEKRKEKLIKELLEKI